MACIAKDLSGFESATGQRFALCSMRYALTLAPFEHMYILDLDVKSRMLRESREPYIELEHKPFVV